VTTIVLAAGIARFDELLVLLGHTSGIYFNGIAKHLRDHGFTVEEPVVPFAESVGERSRVLAQKIRDLGPVHIIAHSMGGLDARHMIIDDRSAAAAVRSLMTIGTPHRGTPFADHGVSHGGLFIKFIDRVAPFSLDGFDDLTTAACGAFNEKVRAAEEANAVKYRVVSASQEESRTFLPLRPSHRIISERERENDGLVSVASQRWTDDGTLGRKRIPVIDFPLPADHLNELGWWDPGETMSPGDFSARVRDFYLQLARRAEAEG
jgi:triacylglycerol lipase